MGTLRGTFQDGSGTITVDQTSQIVFQPNPHRSHLFFQNNHSAAIWIQFGQQAGLAQPSIQLVPNAVYEMKASDFVETSSVHVNGPVNAPFTAKQA